MGGPVETTLLYEDGTGESYHHRDGDRIRPYGHSLVVPAGVWQGSRLAPNNDGFALLGTTMAPGFEFEDYEHGNRADLLESYPGFIEEITRLTR